MKIAFACDHAAHEIKAQVIAFLKNSGHEVVDFGCAGAQSCDYPDYAIPAATAVAKGTADRGVLICGTGIGMSITANKVPGIRAALVTNNDVARLTREHNDSNIICLAARFATVDEITRWVTTWLTTPFTNEARHCNRLAKIAALERNCRP